MNTKKILLMIGVAMTLTLAMVLAGCGSGSDEEATAAGSGADISSVEVDLGDSELYSEADREAAVEIIKEEFSKWDGCKLNDIRYAGDECNSKDNIKWMNELAEGQDIEPGFTECIEFLSDFHSPVKPEEPTAWEPDTDYTDYQWWLARKDDNEWVLMTNGY